MLYVIVALFGIGGLCGVCFNITLIAGLVSGVANVSLLRWFLLGSAVSTAAAVGVTAYVVHKEQKTYRQIFEEAAKVGLPCKAPVQKV